MARLQAALDGGIKPERTRELLVSEWFGRGGTSELLAEQLDNYRRWREVIDPDEAEARGAAMIAGDVAVESPRAPRASNLPEPVKRLLGVSQAIAEIDHFLTEDRPRIVEAAKLGEMRKSLYAMSLDHLTRHPDDTEVGRAFMALQELIFERTRSLATSPAAIGLWMSRPGRQIALLARLVVAPLRWRGYDWAEIAEIVDDGGGAGGRGERLRKLHEDDLIRKTLARARSGVRPKTHA